MRFNGTGGAFNGVFGAALGGARPALQGKAAVARTSSRNMTPALSPSAMPNLDSLPLAGKGMSFDGFKELLNSDAPISDKLAVIQEAFGDVVNEEALGISIQAARDGKMSMEEMYRRVLARSAGLAVTDSESRANLEAVRGLRRGHFMSLNNEEAIARKSGPILWKLRLGGTLSAKERSFLRRHFPEKYQIAARAEMKARGVREAVRRARTRDGARHILLNAKMTALSDAENTYGLFLVGKLNRIDPDNPSRNVGSRNRVNVII